MQKLTSGVYPIFQKKVRQGRERDGGAGQVSDPQWQVHSPFRRQFMSSAHVRLLLRCAPRLAADAEGGLPVAHAGGVGIRTRHSPVRRAFGLRGPSGRLARRLWSLLCARRPLPPYAPATLRRRPLRRSIGMCVLTSAVDASDWSFSLTSIGGIFYSGVLSSAFNYFTVRQWILTLAQPASIVVCSLRRRVAAAGATACAQSTHAASPRRSPLDRWRT